MFGGHADDVPAGYNANPKGKSIMNFEDNFTGVSWKRGLDCRIK